MSPEHPAQLRICHEPIAAVRVVLEPVDRASQFCSLKDVRWCQDCGYYVCTVHAEARHVAHHLIED